MQVEGGGGGGMDRFFYLKNVKIVAPKQKKITRGLVLSVTNALWTFIAGVQIGF